MLFSLKLWHLILTLWMYSCFDITSNFFLQVLSHENVFYFKVCFYQVILLFKVLFIVPFVTSELSLQRFHPNIILEKYVSSEEFSVFLFREFPFRIFYHSELPPIRVFPKINNIQSLILKREITLDKTNYLRMLV